MTAALVVAFVALLAGAFALARWDLKRIFGPSYKGSHRAEPGIEDADNDWTQLLHTMNTEGDSPNA